MKNPVELKKFQDKFTTIVRGITDKESYLAIVKQPTFMGWFVGVRVCQMKPKLFPVRDVDRFKIKVWDFESTPIIQFLRNEKVRITCGDGVKLLQKYQHNANCLLLVDPPYVLSCNSFYTHQDINVYEYCAIQKLETMNAMVVFVLEDNWILRLLFGKFIRESYGKMYENNFNNRPKKRTTHIIICNR
jgi:hypothetical protein